MTCLQDQGRVESTEAQSWLRVGVGVSIGRGRERAEVAGLVATSRVVTLTGAGGCGTTRLAVEVVGTWRRGSPTEPMGSTCKG